jgi:ATP-dependent Zn protease
MEEAPNEQLEPELTDPEPQRMEQRYRDALNDRKLLAIHEGGHAAVAEHLNMGVVRVFVIEANRSFTEVNKRPPSMETLRDDLTMALAGYFAVLKETGEEYIANIHCGIDNQLMFDLFKALSIDEKDQKMWMKEARPIAKELVDRYWSAIQKMADELHKFPQMSGAEVRRILAEVP